MSQWCPTWTLLPVTDCIMSTMHPPSLAYPWACTSMHTAPRRFRVIKWRARRPNISWLRTQEDDPVAELLNYQSATQDQLIYQEPLTHQVTKIGLRSSVNSKHSVDLCLWNTKDCGDAKTWSLPPNNSDIRQWRKADKCCVCYTSVCVSYKVRN